VNAHAKVENANLAIWNVLSKTDPAHTKQFKRGGGFSGTAIKPIWIVKMLTEQFGPCGKGWGMDKPEYQLVPGDNRELLVFCTVSGWYVEDGEKCRVFGVGGDKVITYIKANEQYKRPERWENDDEAFKKAFTDAVNNAFKFVGVGADVHMGMFDDSKYVREAEAEFRQRDETEKPEKIAGIHKIKERLRELRTAGDATDSLETFNAQVKAAADDLTKIRDAKHEWWTGGGDVEGFRDWIVRRRAELDGDNMVSRMIADMKEQQTPTALSRWLGAHNDVIEALDGPDARRFQLACDLHESALQQVATLTAG